MKLRRNARRVAELEAQNDSLNIRNNILADLNDRLHDRNQTLEQRATKATAALERNFGRHVSKGRAEALSTLRGDSA